MRVIFLRRARARSARRISSIRARRAADPYLGFGEPMGCTPPGGANTGRTIDAATPAGQRLVIVGYASLSIVETTAVGRDSRSLAPDQRLRGDRGRTYRRFRTGCAGRPAPAGQSMRRE